MTERKLHDHDSRERIGSVLIIPFEDRSLLPIVSEGYSGARVTVLEKKHLAGSSLRTLLTKLRQDRWDVAICSLYGSTVHRSRSSAELMLGVIRARHRYLRVGENDYTSITGSRLLFFLLPKLLIGIVGGLLSALALYCLLTSNAWRARVRSNRPAVGSNTILFLRTDLPGELKAGGSVSHIKGMISAFLKSGFRVVYVADAKMAALPPEVIQIVVNPIGAFDILDEFQLIAYNFQLLIRSGNWIAQYSPSLVYQRHGIFSIVGGMIARRANVPFVLEANASEVWAKATWSRLVLRNLGRRCEAEALRFAQCVSVISQGVREQLEPYGIADNKFIVNPNGVDPAEFNPAIDGGQVREKYGLGSRTVVGFIGTFTKWHGVETLFQAAATLARSQPNIVFLLIGDGDLRSTLQQQSETMGVAGSIIFTGLIPHGEASSHLAACDILVSPHLGFDGGTKFFGSPTKLFEYMAMGKAIVASNLEQLGEVISDNRNGLLFEPGNVDQLTRQILRLAVDPDLAKRLALQARTDVESNYTWSRNVERILTMLRWQ